MYRSPDGSGWIAALELPMLGDGRRRKRRDKTRAEAQELLRQMKDELANAGSASSAQRTGGDAVESFMARRELEALAAGTRDNDRWLAGRSPAAPAVGSHLPLPVSELNPRAGQRSPLSA